MTNNYPDNIGIVNDPGRNNEVVVTYILEIDGSEITSVQEEDLCTMNEEYLAAIDEYLKDTQIKIVEIWEKNDIEVNRKTYKQNFKT